MPTPGKEGKVPKGERQDKLIISAPGPGKCPVCGVKHGEHEPHDTRSLYYQHRYYKKYRKLPPGTAGDDRGNV